MNEFQQGIVAGMGSAVCGMLAAGQIKLAAAMVLAAATTGIFFALLGRYREAPK